MSLAVVLATLELDRLRLGDLCRLRDSSPEAVLEFGGNAFFEPANTLKLESELQRGVHHISLPLFRHAAVLISDTGSDRVRERSVDGVDRLPEANGVTLPNGSDNHG